MVVAASQQQSSPIYLVKEALYVGIDIGKEAHVAAFLSSFLLRKCKRYTNCPTIPIKNIRLDFERLVHEMLLYAPLEQITVVMEKTGHYHLALLQYLQERGLSVYLVHVQKRPRKQKNDRRDAQGLANMGYAQIELGAQPDSPEQEIHQVLPVSETAQTLRGLTNYRRDLARQMTRARNQLVAISDLLFPEFHLVFKDVNNPTARIFRLHFPTASDMAHASFSDLLACRIYYYPGRDALIRLQELAAHSIGVKEPGCVRALILEQALLIKQLNVLEENEEAIKAEISAIVEESRAGQIIMSLGDFVGTLAAGEILAALGDITNFETSGKLRGYAGWNPVEDQSGKSKNGVALNKGGNRMLKDTMFLVGMRAINKKYDGENWRDLYDRLVERQCPYDAKKKKRTGKLKPLSRVIGQIASMIYLFLKKDAEVIATAPPGVAPPEPMMYNKDVHRSHMKRRR